MTKLRVSVSTLAVLASLGASQVMGQAAPPAPPAAPQQERPAPPPVTLHVGDPAPPFNVRWIKGERPVDFTDGKVHVLEFWATWCGPCKRNMPHMSELARKYRGRVEVLSISIWERSASPGLPYEDEVINFVEHAGEMMDHPVAMDSRDNFMGTNWTRASGQNGIPAAIIVDRQGRIAWAGTAFAGIDEAIELALQDKLDAAAGAQVKANYQAGMKRRGELRAAAEAALKEGKPDEAIKLANEASEAMHVFANGQWPILYRAYKAKGNEQATAFVDRVAKEHATAPIDLIEFARAVGDEDPASRLKLLQAAMSHSRPTDPMYAMPLAQAYAGAGDYTNAIATQENALKGLSKAGSDQRVLDMVREQTRLLEEYRTKAGKSAPVT